MLMGSSFAGRSTIRIFFSMGRYKTLLSNALLLCVQWHRTLLNSCACSSQATSSWTPWIPSANLWSQIDGTVFSYPVQAALLLSHQDHWLVLSVLLSSSWGSVAHVQDSMLALLCHCSPLVRKQLVQVIIANTKWETIMILQVCLNIEEWFKSYLTRVLFHVKATFESFATCNNTDFDQTQTKQYIVSCTLPMSFRNYQKILMKSYKVCDLTTLEKEYLLN